jgi:hypothetical protein
MPTAKQRTSINLPDNGYAELAAFTEQHNISTAWIDR